MACASAAGSVDWVPIRGSDPNITFYVDRSSINEAGESVSFWESLVYTRPDKVDDVSGKYIKEKRVYRVMNCHKRTQGFRYGGTFAENGRLIEALTLEEHQMQMVPITAGTVAEGEFKLVCETVAKKSR
jgi:hypothetical protein